MEKQIHPAVVTVYSKRAGGGGPFAWWWALLWLQAIAQNRKRL